MPRHGGLGRFAQPILGRSSNHQRQPGEAALVREPRYSPVFGRPRSRTGSRRAHAAARWKYRRIPPSRFRHGTGRKRGRSPHLPRSTWWECSFGFSGPTGQKANFHSPPGLTYNPVRRLGVGRRAPGGDRVAVGRWRPGTGRPSGLGRFGDSPDGRRPFIRVREDRGRVT